MSPWCILSLKGIPKHYGDLALSASHFSLEPLAAQAAFFFRYFFSATLFFLTLSFHLQLLNALH
jgi:hypothetical protein